MQMQAGTVCPTSPPPAQTEFAGMRTGGRNLSMADRRDVGGPTGEAMENHFYDKLHRSS